MSVTESFASRPEFFADYADESRRVEHVRRLGALTGREATDPYTLDRYQAIASGDKSVAAWYWDTLHEQVRLEGIIQKDESEIRIMTQLVERLSVDANTRILTYNTQQVLFERMAETGLLKEMHLHGYALEMLLLDLDKLKQHNAIGGHAGGDAAILKMVECLKPVYRRKTDFLATPGLLGHQGAARNAVQHADGFRQLGRFEKGDEIIGLNFMSPHKMQGGQRDHLGSINKRATQIAKALRDVWVSYKYASRQSPEELREKFGEECIDFSVDEEGMVTARVSGTFAVARAPLPVTTEGLNNIFRQADHAMNGIKSNRTGIQTRGVPVSLFTVE